MYFYKNIFESEVIFRKKEVIYLAKKYGSPLIAGRGLMEEEDPKIRCSLPYFNKWNMLYLVPFWPTLLLASFFQNITPNYIQVPNAM